jgi:hypothetical protein
MGGLAGSCGVLVCLVEDLTSPDKPNKPDESVLRHALREDCCWSALRLWFLFEQVREAGEGREGGRPILLMARGRGFSCLSHAVPLVLIVVTVETEQLPVAPIWRIVVVVMVLMMDRELVEFLAVKFAAAMRTDPGKHFERPLSIALVLMRLVAPRHASSGKMDTCYGEILQELLDECLPPAAK